MTDEKDWIVFIESPEEDVKINKCVLTGKCCFANNVLVPGEEQNVRG